MKTQQGFTLIELLVVMFGIAAIALAGGLLYIVFHFLMKFW